MNELWVPGLNDAFRHPFIYGKKRRGQAKKLPRPTECPGKPEYTQANKNKRLATSGLTINCRQYRLKCAGYHSLYSCVNT